MIVSGVETLHRPVRLSDAETGGLRPSEYLDHRFEVQEGAIDYFHVTAFDIFTFIIPLNYLVIATTGALHVIGDISMQTSNILRCERLELLSPKGLLAATLTTTESGVFFAIFDHDGLQRLTLQLHNSRPSLAMWSADGHPLISLGVDPDSNALGLALFTDAKIEAARLEASSDGHNVLYLCDANGDVAWSVPIATKEAVVPVVPPENEIR